MMGPNLWIVGRNIPHDCDECKLHSYWEFVGAYDNEKAAVAVCKDWSFFVGPAVLNQTVPEETVIWPGIYYPKAEKKKSNA